MYKHDKSANKITVGAPQPASDIELHFVALCTDLSHILMEPTYMYSSSFSYSFFKCSWIFFSQF